MSLATYDSNKHNQRFKEQ